MLDFPLVIKPVLEHRVSHFGPDVTSNHNTMAKEWIEREGSYMGAQRNGGQGDIDEDVLESEEVKEVEEVDEML